MLLPGVTLNTGREDRSPIETMQLVCFEGERWVVFGEPLDTRQEFGPVTG
jgi:branched-chain amino acid transport system substrate-binding protein